VTKVHHTVSHSQRDDASSILCLLRTAFDRATVSALSDLYTATNGPSWLNNMNWLMSDPCANSWYGVVCTSGLILQLYVSLALRLSVSRSSS